MAELQRSHFYEEFVHDLIAARSRTGIAFAIWG
jgi:hypothetical protein